MASVAASLTNWRQNIISIKIQANHENHDQVINDGTASQTPPTVCVEFGFILIRNYPKDKCHNTV